MNPQRDLLLGEGNEVGSAAGLPVVDEDSFVTEEESWELQEPIYAAEFPDAAPHYAEEAVVGVICCAKHYYWCIFDGFDAHEPFFPTMFWRTTALSKDELKTEFDSTALLKRYWPSQALEYIFGKNCSVHSKEAALRFRSSKRIPTLSVYCILNDQFPQKDKMAAEESLQCIFKDFPVNLLKLEKKHFLDESDPYLLEDAMTAEQAAACKAARHYYAPRPVLLLDCSTALTCTAMAPPSSPSEQDKVLVTGQSLTVSVTAKLERIHEMGGPEISSKAVLAVMEDCRARGKPLPLICNDNQSVAILATALHETAAVVRSIVRAWASGFADEKVVDEKEEDKAAKESDEKKDEAALESDQSKKTDDTTQKPVVCVTGRDTEIMMKLLGKDCSSIVEIPDKELDVEVQEHRHLAFHGVRMLFQQHAHGRSVDPVEAFRQELRGLRVAKNFAAPGRVADIYRGHVVLTLRDREEPYSIDKDLFRIRYDDGDAEDIEPLELFDVLNLYLEVLESIKDPDQLRELRTKRMAVEGAARKLAEMSIAVQHGLVVRGNFSKTVAVASGSRGSTKNGANRKSSIVKGRETREVKDQLEPPPKKHKSMEDEPLAQSETSPTRKAEPESTSAPKSPGSTSQITPNKQRNEQPMEDASGYVGRRIAKYFDGNLYFGTVREKRDTEEVPVWFIEYDDGDTEELEAYELRAQFTVYVEHLEEDPYLQAPSSESTRSE